MKFKYNNQIIDFYPKENETWHVDVDGDEITRIYSKKDNKKTCKISLDQFLNAIVKKWGPNRHVINPTGNGKP
jgi:hypothetical protein